MCPSGSPSCGWTLWTRLPWEIPDRIRDPDKSRPPKVNRSTSLVEIRIASQNSRVTSRPCMHSLNLRANAIRAVVRRTHGRLPLRERDRCGDYWSGTDVSSRMSLACRIFHQSCVSRTKPPDGTVTEADFQLPRDQDHVLSP